MATETVEAGYENGGFRPITPVAMNLAEGQEVRLVEEPIGKPDDLLALAARAYEGLSEDRIKSIERHSRRRESFFRERTSA